MRKFLITISTLLSLFLVIPQQSYATALTLDPTFNAAGTGFAGGTAREPVITDNGTKYILVGTFTSYNGSTANRIAKINMDGSLDTTFMTNVGTGFTQQTTGMGVQSDGKIVISGFPSQSYNGTSLSGGVTRLNADGTLDTDFKTTVGTSTPGGLLGIEVLPNDKILLLGSSSFTSFNGAPASRIFMLNADGTPDTAFNENLATDIWVQAGLSQLNAATYLSDGKILINGNSLGRSSLFRLNADGTLDNTFNSGGTGTDLGVWDHKILSNNKIIVVGQFTTYNGVSAPRIMLLDYDGNVDPSFISGTGIAVNTPVGVIDVPSGLFVVTHNTPTTYNSVTLPYYLAINQDGSAPALDFGTGFNAVGSSDPGIINNDGKLMLVGSFTTYNGSTVSTGIIRFNQDFTPPTVSNIHLASNNTNQSYASEGHVVTLSFTSNDAVTGSTITLGGQSVTPSCSGTAPTVTCSATLTITSGIPAADGLITFSISVTSAGGVSATSTTTSDGSSVTIDRIVPVVSISSPANGSTVGTTISSVTGTCESGLSVSISASGATPSSQTVACTGGTYSSSSLTTTSAPSITVSQADNAGNSSATFASYTRDAVAPVVTIQTPATGSNPFGTTTVSGTCENGLTVTLSGTNMNSTTTTCSGGLYTVDINVLGQLSLTVSQTDAVNNTGTAQFNAIAPGAPLLVSSINPSAVTLPGSTGSSKTFISPLDKTVQQCAAFKTNLKFRDPKNNQTEVMLLQAFLNSYQNEKIPVTGFFGTRTFAALKRFQLSYKKEVLTPWKITKPTGHFYQATRAKANQILGCPEGVIILRNGTTISGN